MHNYFNYRADPTPTMIGEGSVVERDDRRTTHKETNVIVVQEMVHLSPEDIQRILIISDDTDVCDASPLLCSGEANM